MSLGSWIVRSTSFHVDLSITDAVVSITDAVVSITDAVVSITDAVVSITDAVVSITDAIVSITDAIISIPEAIVSITDAIISITDAIVSITDAIVSITDAIVSIIVTDCRNHLAHVDRSTSIGHSSLVLDSWNVSISSARFEMMRGRFWIAARTEKLNENLSTQIFFKFILESLYRF